MEPNADPHAKSVLSSALAFHEFAPSYQNGRLAEHQARAGHDRTLLEGNLASLDALSASSFGIPLSTPLHAPPDPEIARLLEDLTDTLASRVRPVAHDYLLPALEISDGRNALNNPASAAYFRYLQYSQLTWQTILEKGGSALVASTQDYLAYAQRPGTHLIEAAGEGILRKNGSDVKQNLGLAYALITLEKAGISDLSDFPEWIQKLENPARLFEVLNVSFDEQLKLLNFPEGMLADLVFDTVEKIAPDQPIITRIVRGEYLPGAQEMTTRYAYPWSIKALEKRGFEYTGPENDIVFDAVLPAIAGVREEAQTLRLVDGVFIRWPHRQTERQVVRTEQQLDIRRHVWERIAIATTFPKSGKVAVWSDSYQDHVDFAFAEQQEGSAVIAVHTHEKWRDTYRHNLDHVQANADGSAFPPKTLDGILSVNMLRQAALEGTHTILQQNAFDFVHRQIEQLADYGRYAGRELIIPSDWPSQVIITLDEGSAEHFERYAREAYAGEGCPYTPIELPGESARSYLLASPEAIKFAFLVNPYRAEADFAREKDLPAPLFTDHDYIRLLRKFDIRVDAAHPVYTDYVQDSFLRGKIKFHTPDGTALPLPPNQFEIVGQKVQPSDGVVVEEVSGVQISQPRYLSRTVFRSNEPDTAGKPVYREFIARKGSEVYGLFPITRVHGELAVPIRENHQRPIPNALLSRRGRNTASDQPRDVAFDGTLRSGYGMEALAVTRLDPLESPEVAITRGLHKLALMPIEEIPTAEQLRRFSSGLTFPSSSGLQEEWRDIVIPTESAAYLQTIEGQHTGFLTPTRVRPVLLKDIVSVGESSGPISSPLLRVAYRELLKAGEPLPAWNGPRVSLTNQLVNDIVIHDLSAIHHDRERLLESRWQRVPEDALPADYRPFYEIREGNFIERDGTGKVISKAGVPAVERLEYATLSEDTGLSNNTVVFCPVAIVNGEPIVLLETRANELPLLDFRTGLAKPEVVPAFRIDLKTATLAPQEAEVAMIERFESCSGVRVIRGRCEEQPNVWTLAPEILVAAGAVPERAYLRLVEVDASTIGNSHLRAFRLRDLAMDSGELYCGHSINSVLRAAHALNCFAPLH